MPPITVRVLLADDHPLYVDALEALLAAEPAVDVVGRAGDGATAVELARRLRPDVVVLDVEMPILDGIAAARWIRRDRTADRIVVLTGADDPWLEADARAAGASEFLRKGCDPVDLVAAVTAAGATALAVA